MSENTVKWHTYPKEKPKCADEYLVTINCGYFNTTSTSDWKDGKFTDYENKPQKIGSIIAWAEMPEPYKGGVMSKAWYAHNEYEGTVIAVFADTRSKARKYIWDNNNEKDLGFDKYTEINPKRFERIDYFDKPDGYVMDWNKAEDRLVLVKESGWYCSDPTLDDCKICTASNYCDLYAEGLVTK